MYIVIFKINYTFTGGGSCCPGADGGDGVKFIGTLEAEGLSGYEASALHGALRVVAGRNRAYKEALYDQFAPEYARRAPEATHVESLLNPSRAPSDGEHATG